MIIYDTLDSGQRWGGTGWESYTHNTYGSIYVTSPYLFPFYVLYIHMHFFFLSFFLSPVFLQRIYRQSRRSNLGWKYMMRQETQKNKEKKIFPSSFFFFLLPFAKVSGRFGTS